MSRGCDTRVSIPNNVRKVIFEVKKTLGSKHSEEFVYTTLKDCDMDPKEATRRLKMIHGIREIAGKHSIEDVYTMLKDCNMDPDEAAQRLLYIDTFHEVKKKHGPRKYISSDKSEDFKRTHGNQWKGAKVGRGTFYSSKAFDDVRGGRVSNHQERVSRLTTPVHSGKEYNVAHVANSAANGNHSHKLAPELSPDADVAPSQKTHHTCAVGIKCEIVSKSKARLPAATIPAIPEAADSENTKSETKPSPLAAQKPVIFPDHLQVPENFKTQFTFGSLDATTPDDSQSQPPSMSEPSQQNDEVVPELSEDDNINISSDPAIKHDQIKVETLPPFQNPILQTPRDYSFGFMPHLMGPHFVQPDVPELQSSATEPATTGQNSSALCPPMFPYFRQIYPNYIPYNPYFPHMYLPLNHGLIPHQSLPTSVKLPNSPQYKQEGNLTSVNQETKDSNLQVHTQGEGVVPNLVPNYFYNIPYQMGVSPLQAAAFYHSCQPLMYQSQASGGTVQPPYPPLINRETT